MKPHTIEELSDGERVKREAKLVRGMQDRSRLLPDNEQYCVYESGTYQLPLLVATWLA